MAIKPKLIGLVATGDELVNGDILNTNGQYFTQKFVDQGLTPGQQVIVGDDVDEIEKAISYLLQTHSAVITIGGLGPTSDDKTRIALARALNLELEFNEQAWQWIVDILTHKGLGIPETNRQQALMPKNAEVIYNPHGTAAACYIRKNQQDIFMLPGPPNECLPIFDNVVLPKLLELNYATPSYWQFWLLYGVSESLIASKLDPLMQNNPECVIGYRVHYPYLEIKLHSANSTALQQLAQQFTPHFADRIVSENHETASQQFVNWLERTDKKVEIVDQATGGALQQRLSFPNNYAKLQFVLEPTTHKSFIVKIKGLDDYWNGLNPKTLALDLTIMDADKIHHEQHSIPFRGRNSLNYAVELICWRLLQYLNNQSQLDINNA